MKGKYSDKFIFVVPFTLVSFPTSNFNFCFLMFYFPIFSFTWLLTVAFLNVSLSLSLRSTSIIILSYSSARQYTGMLLHCNHAFLALFVYFNLLFKFSIILNLLCFPQISLLYKSLLVLSNFSIF